MHIKHRKLLKCGRIRRRKNTSVLNVPFIPKCLLFCICYLSVCYLMSVVSDLTQRIPGLYSPLGKLCLYLNILQSPPKFPTRRKTFKNERSINCFASEMILTKFEDFFLDMHSLISFLPEISSKYDSKKTF